MADKKDAVVDGEPKVTPAPAGVEAQASSVKPARSMTAKDVKASLAHRPDADLHPAGEPEREADKTSYPVPNDAEPNDPPYRTTRPDVPILSSLATGAGAHVPPDPKAFTPEGRPRDLPGHDE